MNIHELSVKTGISLSALRKLDRLKVLKVDKESTIAAAIRFHLARNPQLSAAHMVALIDEPDLFFELERYEARARAQIAALGDVPAGAAPADVTAAIFDAAKGDKGAAAIIADWAKGILPVEPVGHHWLCARLLYPLNAFLREQTAPRLQLALLVVRSLPEFAAWWHSDKTAKRNIVRYAKPVDEKALDL